ncbi:HesA/MoeB/ThiF family protein [Shewanella sp. UCD-KL12]|uniref:HesA/MoeB/ThiF family protein n=1 Tax=Shewanella sp. UCD-KL12 TaxID=1917163 RepID=UPI00097130B4|nr:HesA/MoeB/ThiF family protein [Shewanella sp. UCD-KL12]
MSLSDADFMRFSRQVLLPEVGERGQVALSNAHVTVIGMGGLGHLVAQYLAAAGVGTLTLIDHDKIEVSNLPRQLLYSSDDIGYFKADIARDKLTVTNHACAINAVTVKAIDSNIRELLAKTDLILDCTDNFSTRQLINTTCVKQQVPLISASVAHFSGQLLIVDLNQSPESGCYNCLFPEDSVVTHNCQTTGVLGPMVGVMASMQSLVAMNYLMGIDVPFGKLLQFDGLKMCWREIGLSRDLSCESCQSSIANATQC